jgi:hypothetical protein
VVGMLQAARGEGQRRGERRRGEGSWCKAGTDDERAEA